MTNYESTWVGDFDFFEGKYLKLLYALHEGRGTLDAGRVDMQRLCVGCELHYLCEDTLLTVYCLESILRKRGP